MYETLGISKKVLDFAAEIEEHLKTRFQEIDERAEFNQLKVIHAMQECRVSDIHFAATTGYGYNDLGRDTLEEVYAHVFHTESALVRPQLMSGTHALMWLFPETCVPETSSFPLWESPMIPWRK